MDREAASVNESKHNQRGLKRAAGFVFVSCPDFSHENGAYNFRTLGNGLPLSIIKARDELRQVTSKKPLKVFLSDHEAERQEVQAQLKIGQEEMLRRIQGSLEAIHGHFPDAQMLGSWFPYERVCEMRPRVPIDERATRFLTITGTKEQEASYREKYAQTSVLMEACWKENLCPVFMFSRFNVKLVLSIRDIFRIPVLFIDVSDPH